MLQLLLVLYRPSPTNTHVLYIHISDFYVLIPSLPHLTHVLLPLSMYLYGILNFISSHLTSSPGLWCTYMYLKFLSPHISLPRLTHDIAICICLRFLFPHCLTSTPNPCTIIPIYHDISDFYVLITSVPHPTQMLLPHITIIPQIFMSSPPRFHTQLKCYITHM